MPQAYALSFSGRHMDPWCCQSAGMNQFDHYLEVQPENSFLQRSYFDASSTCLDCVMMRPPNPHPGYDASLTYVFERLLSAGTGIKSQGHSS